MATAAKKRGKKAPARMGRPSAYRPEFAAQATKLCLLGATDADLADFFDVTVTTIKNWKAAHPDFLAALKAGKEQADAAVAKSLYRRALGYTHPAVKIVADAKTGDHLAVPYTERYPPDTTAAIFWLKNRRPDVWRDRQEVKVDATVTTPPGHLAPAERADLVRRILADQRN